ERTRAGAGADRLAHRLVALGAGAGADRLAHDVVATRAGAGADRTPWLAAAPAVLHGPPSLPHASHLARTNSRPKSCSAASALCARQRSVRLSAVAGPPSACGLTWCTSRNAVSRQRWPRSSSPSSRRRRKTSVERIALAHAPCGVCVKLSSMKQKGPRSNAREGRCCTKLSTRCSTVSGARSAERLPQARNSAAQRWLAARKYSGTPL